MIFQKSALQGNFIFADGTQALFTDGYYETEKQAEIDQLAAIYQSVEKKVEAEAIQKPEAAKAMTGMQSSGSLTNKK